MTSYLHPKRTVCFLLLPHLHLLDLSGAAQVFYEATQLGAANYDVVFCSPFKEIISEQGLVLSNLNGLDFTLTSNDFIFVPGISFQKFISSNLRQEIEKVKSWLRKQKEDGVQIASICSGALVLAEAGILDGRKCTTHWKCIDYIKTNHPSIRVQIDQLFVKDGNIYTSAGMTSGIDMALSIIEEEHGPLLTAKVAREIVVYMRRNSSDTQQTIYLDYKTHFNPSIHKVQDHIISNPSKNFTLADLADTANTSVRSLTRLFKKTTGHTIVEFKNAVKLELAKNLANNPEYTQEKIASMCGFENARHMRRLLKGR